MRALANVMLIQPIVPSVLQSPRSSAGSGPQTTDARRNQAIVKLFALRLIQPALHLQRRPPPGELIRDVGVEEKALSQLDRRQDVRKSLKIHFRPLNGDSANNCARLFFSPWRWTSTGTGSLRDALLVSLFLSEKMRTITRRQGHQIPPADNARLVLVAARPRPVRLQADPTFVTIL